MDFISAFCYLSVGWDVNQFYMFLECHKNAVELAKFHRSYLNHRKFLQPAYFGYYLGIYYRLAWRYHFCSISLAWSQVILQPLCYYYAKWWLKVFCITFSSTLKKTTVNQHVICHTSFISFCVQWFYCWDFRWSGKIPVYSEKLQIA